MSDKAYIRLKGVSLRFPLYNNNDPNTKSRVVNFFTKKDENDTKKKYIQALDDINLDIEEGQSVGIVGRNGAGKSTLVSLISKIYTPNKGELQISGKIVTLMSMGIGFNNNLDAFENIKIAGLIMGLEKEDIKERTNKILEFAELEDFSNLPIKYYSKGMRARLGFSTATEIDPEILILDEVFSGGDVHWLEKANDRMKGIIKRSKIVIIVSHSTGRIKELCNRVIWLDHGKVIMDGDANDVMDKYTAMYSANRY